MDLVWTIVGVAPEGEPRSDGRPDGIQGEREGVGETDLTGAVGVDHTDIPLRGCVCPMLEGDPAPVGGPGRDRIVVTTAIVSTSVPVGDSGLSRPIGIRDVDLRPAAIGGPGAVGDLLSVRRPRDRVRRPDLANVGDGDAVRPVGVYNLERPVYAYKGDLRAVWRPRHVRYTDVSPLRVHCEPKKTRAIRVHDVDPDRSGIVSAPEGDPCAVGRPGKGEVPPRVAGKPSEPRAVSVDHPE